MSRKTDKTYGLLELAYDVLKANIGKTMTAQEIWDLADDEQKTKLVSQARDPVQNIYTMIYQDIKNHEDTTPFEGIGRNPIRWTIKASESTEPVEENADEQESEDAGDTDADLKSSPYNERDLHKILVSYVGSDPYFSPCYCKTIYHEASKKAGKKRNYWIHPDIVGVSYPFSTQLDGYDKRTLGFMKTVGHTECRLYSFEMKIEITGSTLREYYFQAVSNSSWAHEGYLVALKYEPGLESEMKMLNEAFGIGFIELDAENYTRSTRLYPAKRKDELDWNMINRLLTLNSDFETFINTIESDMLSSSVRNNKDFDEPFESEEQCKEYCDDKMII